MSQSPGPSPAGGRPAFRIERWLCGPVTVMSLIGAFNQPAAGRVYPLLVQALIARVPPYLVLDLRRITELTLCTCLMLLLVERHAREAGGRLVVVCDRKELAWAGGVARAGTIEQALAELAARDRDHRLGLLRHKRSRTAGQQAGIPVSGAPPASRAGAPAWRPTPPPPG